MDVNPETTVIREEQTTWMCGWLFIVPECITAACACLPV